jgi:DNA repair protein RecO (recombination protein O)
MEFTDSADMAEKAVAIVVRTTDWSETSRIATLWTREFGKVRVLAKGGRRLKSNFEISLDLLTVCNIVFIRKSSGGLDLLTEAQIVEQFPRLRTDIRALYAGYYVAELLSDWTQDYGPHPKLFDDARTALKDFGEPGKQLGLRLAEFELAMIQELGYSPVLNACAGCGSPLDQTAPHQAFSPSLGGMICRACLPRHRDKLPVSRATLQLLRGLGEATMPRQPAASESVIELRHLLSEFVTYLMGRRPRMLPYLASLE